MQKKTALKLKEKCVNEHCKVTFVHMIVTDVRGTLYSKCRYAERGRRMSRLIDADALLDRIRNPYEQAQVARWVNEQPTVNQWIPCSEHQPKRCAFYIVTDSNEVDEAYYNSDGRWFSWDGNKLKDVVAWMPLPEPYKGEE